MGLKCQRVMISDMPLYAESVEGFQTELPYSRTGLTSPLYAESVVCLPILDAFKEAVQLVDFTTPGPRSQK